MVGFWQLAESIVFLQTTLFCLFGEKKRSLSSEGCGPGRLALTSFFELSPWDRALGDSRLRTPFTSINRNVNSVTPHGLFCTSHVFGIVALNYLSLKVKSV